MNQGYVYIMINDAMPGLIKIGFTKRSPEERKRELSSSTGVPVDFEIKYEIFTHEIKILEKRVHSMLEEYRVSRNREFFKIDLFEGIEVLRNCAEELRLEETRHNSGFNETFEKYESIDILGDLKKLYPKMIRDDIKSIRIY